MRGRAGSTWRRCSGALLALVVAATGLATAPAASADAFSVLVFSKTAGFRHSSIPLGVTAIRRLGIEHGFSVEATEDAAAFTDDNLARFDAVVWLSTTGDVLAPAQEAAFERYVEGGGGYVGVHAAADTEYDWPWYGRLVGAYFKSHPAISDATVVVEDPLHPSMVGRPARWTRRDEWYTYRANPRGDVHVLASLDEATYNAGTHAMGDHPIAWCQQAGGGRAWYTGMGHTEQSFNEDQFLQHLLGGIRTAAGAITASCTPVGEDPPHVLLFSGTYGFRHGSIGTSHTVLRELAERTGRYALTVTEDPADFTPQLLAATDVVLFANTTGETPFTAAQKQQLVDWLGCGGGFIGIHAAADTNYQWPEYQELVGAAFQSHPHTGGRMPGPLRGQLLDQASLWVEDQAHPITAPWHGLASFRLAEEYYRWRVNPRGTQDVHVLLSLDESTVYTGGLTYPDRTAYEPRQPIEWTKSFRGANRVWYTNLGHYDETYRRLDWQQHFVAAVEWIAEQRPDAACLTRK